MRFGLNAGYSGARLEIDIGLERDSAALATAAVVRHSHVTILP